MDDVRQPETKGRPAGEAQEDAPPKRGKGPTFAILGLVLVGGVVGGFLYWQHARHYESTDDAFIDGHVSQIAPQVAGRVVALLVRDNEVVAAGQPLVRIDPRDYQVKLDQATAELAQARAQLAQAAATLEVRRADVAQAGANARAADADRLQTQQDFTRYRSVDRRAISRQQLDTSAAQLRGMTARVQAARHAEGSLRAQLNVAQAQVDAAAATVRADEANLANARLQLSYTEVRAPAPGRVTKRTVELGNYVSPGQAMLAIVQPEIWVTANFKETQLTDMHPGQPVRVKVDAFPDQELSAHVDSLQAGTGSVFSALPAENATGNYVKVVQRLPVKIVLDGEAPRELHLAPGMSVVPRVTVR